MVGLSPRDQEVLKAVIIDYIHTGEPVGSRTVSKKYMKHLGPATIRNIMSDLEEMGYLYQPHTSAGRIPTEKGLRFYLESLMESRKLERDEQELIRRAYQDTTGSTEDVLKRTSQLLSELCAQVGVVLFPKLENVRVKRIEFVRLHEGYIITIIVAESGIVHHRLIKGDEDLSQEELDKYSRYLNDTLKELTLSEIKLKILEEMKRDKIAFDRIYSRVVKLLGELFKQTEELEANVYIEGQANLLNNPEFSDIDRLKQIIRTFEDKSRIVKLLDMTIGSREGVHVILGPESQISEFKEIGVVSSPYRRGDFILGVIGVIGPLRMNYPRIVPIVEFTAKVVSEYMQNPLGKS
ncbi:MAG: heat-inducible transcriptional repressor HrcA [Syntrophobacterales bacterium]|nr:heat-inducible transcriptional repressor HrcA [Syntrophobacterales bacterium]